MMFHLSEKPGLLRKDFSGREGLSEIQLSWSERSVSVQTAFLFLMLFIPGSWTGLCDNSTYESFGGNGLRFSSRTWSTFFWRPCSSFRTFPHNSSVGSAFEKAASEIPHFCAHFANKGSPRTTDRTFPHISGQSRIVLPAGARCIQDVLLQQRRYNTPAVTALLRTFPFSSISLTAITALLRIIRWWKLRDHLPGSLIKADHSNFLSKIFLYKSFRIFSHNSCVYEYLLPTNRRILYYNLNRCIGFFQGDQTSGHQFLKIISFSKFFCWDKKIEEHHSHESSCCYPPLYL